MIRRTVTWALAALLVTALLAGCDPFGLRDVLEAASRSPLSIDPRSVTMPAGATLKFAADGGVPPYAFSVAGDGSIDAATGEYTAPLSAGAATITVTDASGASTDTDIAIEPLGSGLHIVPSNISVVVNASVTFTAVGGTPPYSYAMGAMGSGSPTVGAGTGQYTAGGSIGLDQVIVTDALANTATATVNVVAVASAVDYDVVSVAALPASGVAGAAIGGGYTFSVRNVGTGGGAAALGWRVFLSTNATLDGGDLVVAEGSDAALPAGDTADIAIAGTWPTGPVGGGFLIVALDAVDDTTPANDTQTSPFTLQPRPVDYDVTSVAWTAGTYTGDTVTGTFTVQNVGTAAGASTVYWWVYASIDTAIDGGDYLLQGGNRAALGAGSSAPVAISGAWPSTAASYRLLVHVVAADDIAAGNDIDWTSPVVVTGAPPADVNYAAAAPVNTGGTTTGGSLAGTFVLTKAGADPGTQTVHWTVYRSDDATLEIGTDPVVAVGTHPPMVSGSDVVPFGGTWGANPGTKQLFAVISAGDDTNGTDNTSPGTAVAVTAPNVDYLVNSFSETSGSVAGDPITGALTLKNNGTAGGARPIAWTVYLSPDATLDPAGDFVVDAGSLGALAAGAVSAPTPFDGTWPLVPAAPWTWRLYLVISAPDDVNAGNDTSGTLVRATSAPQADYDVQVVAHTGGTTAGQAFTGEFTVRNLGPHAGTQSVPWSAYLSTNATWDAGVDTLVDSGVTAALANGATSAPIPFDGAWPSGAATWYLVVVVDAGDDPAAANDWAASGSVAVTVPNVNYDVLAVSNTGATTAGGPLAAEFTVKNIGTAAGSRTVYWTAYRSDDAILTVGVDAVIDSGTTAPLGAGVTSAAIPVSNTWPGALVTKNYWLFVRIFVADDVLATDDTESSSMVVVDPPNVDYDVVTINNTGGLVAGAALSGTFQVQNVGTVNGSRTVYWTVYRSLDLVFTPGVDPVVDSGSIPGGLTAGNSSNPTFSGTWPEDTVPRTYYWYVRLIAADDVAAANDEQFSGPLVVNPAVAFPDYRVVSPVYQVTGTPGAALGGVHTFRIQNAAANPGTKTITWRVYASRDAILDGADSLLASSSIGPLGASATTGDIAYGGTWPAFGSFYRLIVSLDADDDTNPANDGWVSGVIEAVEILAPEGAEINSDVGPTLVPLLNVTDRGVVMDEGRYVRISGTMDAKNAFDTYKFTLGADATRLQIALTWSTGDDGCDFYLWDEAGAQGSALSLDINVEEVTFINLTPGAVYYIGVKFLQNHSGQPYQLTVYAEPD